MIYYLIAAIAPLICGLIYKMQREREFVGIKTIEDSKLKRRLTVIAVLPMFLLFVLRYKYVGADTIGYVGLFETEIRDFTILELINQGSRRMEKGFLVYVRLISYLTESYTVFFLITGIIIFGTLIRFALKYTKNPFIFFFLFIGLGTYNFFLTGLRQTLAIIICIWSTELIKNKKLLWFYVLVTLACFFHKSALIFMFVYPLCFIKRTDWLIFWHSVLAIIFVVGFVFFQNLFNEILGYEYSVEETGNGFIFFILILVVYVFSLYMQYDKESMPVITSLATLSLVFWLLRLISRTAERISFYFITYLYAYFANSTVYRKGNLLSFAKYMLILACLVLFVYRNIGAYYKFFWQGGV